MKKVFQKLMFLAAVGTIGFLYSCGEDEETLPDGPTVTVSADATEYEVGQTAIVTIQFTAPGELSGINITPEFDGQAGTTDFNSPADFGLTNTETAGTVTINYDINETLADAAVKLLIDVVDKNNQIATDSVEFTVVAAEPEVSAFPVTLLYAPLGDASSETWFSTNLGRAVTEAEVNASAAPNSSDIDFGYYYGATDLASIASPNSYPTLGGSIDISDWNTRHSTSFRSTSLTAAQFIEVTTNAQVDDAWTNGTDEGEAISGLAVDQVFAFELDPDKGTQRGLVRVVSIEGTFNQNDYIELEIIIQSTEN